MYHYIMLLISIVIVTRWVYLSAKYICKYRYIRRVIILCSTRHTREYYNNDNLLFRPFILTVNDVTRSETRRILKSNDGFLQVAAI